ncbi:MAG: endopeptidase La [Phycisphaerae bacterium]|nr:endopeptidase La [Phycisphaerae bacterium]
MTNDRNKPERKDKTPDPSRSEDPDQNDLSSVSVSIEEPAGEQEPEHPRIPEEVPILTIRDAVAFPGAIVPLEIGRTKSRKVIDAAMEGDRIIGLLAQRHSETEDPGISDLYRIGTAAMILRMAPLPNGNISIICHGMVRFGLEGLLQSDPFLIGKIHTRYDEVGPSTELDALIHTVREMAVKFVELSPNVPDEAVSVLNTIDRPGALADFLGQNLGIGLVYKQELLETFDIVQRLRKISAALTSQLEVLELSQKIQKQVKSEIDKSQREYYLKEQLKAIRRELGEVDERTAEFDDLRGRIDAAKMPEQVAKEANRELERMERIPQASPEYSVARDYIEWLCDIPWSVSTKDRLDINRAAKVLDEDHYDLEKVKKRILEYLAVRKLNPEGRGPILCFAGPPGVGKTSLGKSIARALGRHFIRISLGGIRDEAEIRGHRRTYIGSMPGRVIQEIRKAGTNNPVFMLDEVDKVGTDFRGDPSSALLEVLDPAQNDSFTDHYLDVPFDLSHVMFIATANYMDPIPPALRDRMEIINLPGYTLREKVLIARQYLLPRQLKENGLTAKQVGFSERALTAIAQDYTREAGVRNLEREIGSICRGAAVKVTRGLKKKISITPKALPDFLGAARFELETAQRTSTPGVVTGLAFTPVGGEVIFIEATAMPGRGGLMLTGQIGDVMKESAQAAYSIVRSRSKELKIDAEVLRRSDLHIHVPAGAVPKDGPSAGVAMLTALVSLFKDAPVRPDVAMTGEITLRGAVLPIGGVKEKVLAAHRAGIRTVILPERNRPSLDDVPKDVRRQLEFIFAKNIDQVLRAALRGGVIRSRKKTGSRKRAPSVKKPARKKKSASTSSAGRR